MSGVGGDEIGEGRPRRPEPRRESDGAHGLREGLAKDAIVDHGRAIERGDDAGDALESLFEPSSCRRWRPRRIGERVSSLAPWRFLATLR